MVSEHLKEPVFKMIRSGSFRVSESLNHAAYRFILYVPIRKFSRLMRTGGWRLGYDAVLNTYRIINKSSFTNPLLSNTPTPPLAPLLPFFIRGEGLWVKNRDDLLKKW